MIKNTKIIKIISSIIIGSTLSLNLIGCSDIFETAAGIDSILNSVNGDLIGNKYKINFYDNNGKQYLSASGDKVNIQSNIGEDDELSSLITVNIDGKQIQSCGDTVIFQGDGLQPEVNFTLPDTIDSHSDGNISDNTSISALVNSYYNFFGQSKVVVIQSQLGVPICAYSGKKVYWEVEDNLPKTTKLMIDGKPLYIHRANFQIIDKKLLK